MVYLIDHTFGVPVGTFKDLATVTISWYQLILKYSLFHLSSMH